VRLTIAPTGITHVAPATAVDSLVTPEDAAHIRTSLCNQVHFFASAEAATPWLDTHPGATVMPVHEAYDLGRELAQHFEQDTPPGACC
jgi:alkylmercury lyase